LDYRYGNRLRSHTLPVKPQGKNRPNSDQEDDDYGQRDELRGRPYFTHAEFLPSRSTACTRGQISSTNR